MKRIFTISSVLLFSATVYGDCQSAEDLSMALAVMREEDDLERLEDPSMEDLLRRDLEARREEAFWDHTFFWERLLGDLERLEDPSRILAARCYLGAMRDEAFLDHTLFWENEIAWGRIENQMTLAQRVRRKFQRIRFQIRRRLQRIRARSRLALRFVFG
ncbi:MAG: hypothetical protein LBB05_03580 [Puniceicoccales bacterium]|jgi:hypothetical protein|nr:hypothetical protein [Puniceicoccales bacterium]